MDNDQTRETVKQKFTEYLTEKNCRKTPERYAILDFIYTEPGHFDMDSLYEAMNDRNFRVSRATLYNTMELLLECNLVLKHQFGSNISHYERAYNNDFHHHLICTNCHSVEECKDTELKNLIQNKKIKRFTPSHYSLYIFGVCSKCMKELKSAKKKQDKEKTKK
ncbi:MAG: transcriptional repressor [Candidatus Azobacteroides sp.]|nr:transcriptional repressor [Candidatus Azobacteroides sp.]